MFVLIKIMFYTGFIVKYINCIQEEFMGRPSVGRAIINGREASIQWYPSIVGLRRSSNQYCGGTIIGKDVVLTAAHCIHRRSVHDLNICAGANYRNCRDGIIYNIKAARIHPKFDLVLFDNDFGILQVTENFLLSETVKIARLVSAPVDPGSAVYAIGWGGGENSEEKLQDIKLRVITQAECRKRLPYNNITESMLCTFDKHGRDTCDGDSGGPLFYQGQLAGLTSWGIKCGLPYPAMYSNVFYAIKWIEESIWQFLTTDEYVDLKSTSEEDNKIDSASQQPALSTADNANSRSIKEDVDLSSSSKDLEVKNENVVTSNLQPSLWTAEDSITLQPIKDADSQGLQLILSKNGSANTEEINEDDVLSSSSEDLDL